MGPGRLKTGRDRVTARSKTRFHGLKFQIRVPGSQTLASPLTASSRDPRVWLFHTSFDVVLRTPSVAPEACAPTSAIVNRCSPWFCCTHMCTSSVASSLELSFYKPLSIQLSYSIFRDFHSFSEWNMQLVCLPVAVCDWCKHGLVDLSRKWNSLAVEMSKAIFRSPTNL